MGPGTMAGLGKRTPGAEGLGPIERPVPVAVPGHVVLEVTAAGLRGTDLHIEDGEFPSAPPVIMGHEVAGRVAQVGAGVTDDLLVSQVAPLSDWQEIFRRKRDGDGIKFVFAPGWEDR